MPTDEVLANLRHFTQASPRGRPVEILVLSGVGVASRQDLAAICALARESGIKRITLHAGVEDLGAIQAGSLPVDTLVLPLQVGESGSNLASAAGVLRGCQERGLATVANTELVSSALPHLAGAARVALSTGVQGLTFTYPFPVDGGHSAEAPPPARAMAVLGEVLPALVNANIRVAIRGLPACLLGNWVHLGGKTGNRWYVDADHQLEKALSFFPDVVAFYKGESCRFCVRDGQCDGWFATYLRRPAFGQLAPFETGESPGVA